MGDNKLIGFFERFIQQDSIFKDKRVLQSSFIPNEIEHRDEQINQLANIVAPALKGDTPSNVFIYGKTGTGKTLSIKYTTTNLQRVADESGVNLQIKYINCKLKRVSDTEYRLIAQIMREFGKTVPSTGLPTDEIYNMFYELLENLEAKVVLVLDEIDQLIKKTGDDIIYNLTRINSELKNSSISIIGISNDLVFADSLDPRVKSSLSEEEIIFAPYNAIQIQSILLSRAKLAFEDAAIEEGVIAKCAAYAAREHGDARRALELLRVSGELADRKTDDKISLIHVDEAENKIERDRVLEIVKTQPRQFQATLYCLFLVAKKTNNDLIYTGDVYEVYRNFCTTVDLRPLTQRRVSDIIGELDMYGLISAKTISKGRYGRTREISLSISSGLKPKILQTLEEQLNLR